MMPSGETSGIRRAPGLIIENTLHFGRGKRQEARRGKVKERKNQKFEIRYCMCSATCL